MSLRDHIDNALREAINSCLDRDDLELALYFADLLNLDDQGSSL